MTDDRAGYVDKGCRHPARARFRLTTKDDGGQRNRQGPGHCTRLERGSGQANPFHMSNLHDIGTLRNGRASNNVSSPNSVQPHVAGPQHFGPISGFMGIKERQERDREAVSRAILDAARDLFVRDGFEHVSIRKIAELIEYSPAAIYGYFPSKDDIFFALAEEGFRLLHGDQQHRAVLEALSPVERVRAIFWRLYVFSCEHPQYFALMFVDRTVPRISREYERFTFAREIKRALVSDVEAAMRSGDLPSTVTPDLVLRIVSSALIGVAVLRLSDRLTPGEDPDALARDVLEVTLAGLAAAPSIRTVSADYAQDRSARSLHDAHVS